MGGELVVAVHDGVKLVVHGVFVQWVKRNLLVLLAVKSHSDGLFSDV